MDIEGIKLSLEVAKFRTDLVKHVSTLASGAIVVLVTFMDRIPKPLRDVWIFEVALALLVACILACFLIFLIGFTRDWDKADRGRLDGLHIALVIAIYFTFWMGMVTLGAFASSNLGKLQ